MQARYIADRSLLLSLWLQHPDWTTPALAQATGRSVAWVKKWKARFGTSAHPEEEVWGRSHPPAPGPRFSAAVVAQILAIRDDPPEHLQRVPGPKAILYYLPRTDGLEGERLPRSTRTIWKILRAADRIAPPRRRPHRPQDRPEPLGELQLDFKDVVQVDPLVSAKQAHAVEVFDAVDVGTSLWLMGEPSASYTAEAVFAPLMSLLERVGLPERIRFDRDPRFLGGTGRHDFPTPFLRFWYALGVIPVVNPPHRPDLNAFVERLHGTLEREYRQQLRPGSLEATRESLPLFQQHYNTERPHQGRSCGNQPPAVAFPQLPLRPRLPARVDPDRWLQAYHGRCFARRVKTNGEVVLDEQPYYVGRRFAGQEVVAQLEAPSQQVLVLDGQRRLLAVKPLRGLVGEELSLEAFVIWCEKEARSRWRRYLSTQHHLRQAS
ncbi:MAG TPA: integrase core domain-containing protein [Ktedonobacterales bacterium]